MSQRTGGVVKKLIEFGRLALAAAKPASAYDPNALADELFARAREAFEDLMRQGVTNYVGIECKEIDLPYDGTSAGSFDGPREWMISSSTARVDGKERAARALVVMFKDPFDSFESMLPFGGWARWKVAALGKERFIKKRCDGLIGQALRIDAAERAKEGWSLPPGLQAKREMASLAAAVDGAKAAPRARRNSL